MSDLKERFDALSDKWAKHRLVANGVHGIEDGGRKLLEQACENAIYIFNSFGEGINASMYVGDGNNEYEVWLGHTDMRFVHSSPRWNYKNEYTTVFTFIYPGNNKVLHSFSLRSDQCGLVWRRSDEYHIGDVLSGKYIVDQVLTWFEKDLDSHAWTYRERDESLDREL